MAEQITPVNNQDRLAQLLGDDFLAEAPSATRSAAAADPSAGVTFSGNIFDDFLSKAVDALEGVSQTEFHTNEMIAKYLRGEVELHEVMTAQAKLGVQVQFAVTMITSVVSTFKEITQMQV
ncbi:hypothetical protein A2291_07170 [candidate division WOR-1 bacterium RIFOXYB2_FULL_42_35]|uniref:Flagellar hook-basal body complex protein FliE n=1 Tax=candidate division WOR-1 bacterium RIFOXYC2_FULL_41_25 TaxID=1802586 RepID=A0A1F4TKL6_UNCSA|nr:MAG: hypothetical protein A2247_04510 [candidate division WOR-1 bacterium RIFOXYA2_FULL_41_14]OGC22486.1 MAG: hypothetical protein A2291_07170 [candidate division WOR-1 bacterium RIFOXYB2_FULL_42_35]OGC33224.1 MAG: hypothetical protein A2462_07345 [candidate division WOR-1 bacterium RIFOXYC2_FULL_41_25]OGC43491.1 MAG: hypothetical protein A2548_00880 [candidate division WOR-1 bacterium RIFOXYD2_FULL_41_8]